MNRNPKAERWNLNPCTVTTSITGIPTVRMSRPKNLTPTRIDTKNGFIRTRTTRTFVTSTNTDAAVSP